MYVSHLSLLDFRSYDRVDVEFQSGVNILVGQNGQGKTNLVEAIGYIATLGSHRVATDAALIRHKQPRAFIRSRIVRGDRSQTVEIELINGKANRARINRGTPGRTADALGILKTVLFAPEDLVLVKGEPDARRRFLNELTVFISPRMSAVLSDYDRVIKQRSALLKSSIAARKAGRTQDLSTLDVWDAKLASLGAQIMAFRQRLVHALKPYVHSSYNQVSLNQSSAHITYMPSMHIRDETPVEETEDVLHSVSEWETTLIEALTHVRSKELDRGVCLVGPHRDDVFMALNELPVKGYASHGESWSFALALRLASYRLMTDGPQHDSASDELSQYWWTDSDVDTEPVLILDDVFAELDSKRRRQLAHLIADARQVIITAAVGDDIPEELSGKTFYVSHGQVSETLEGLETEDAHEQP
ncbi:DNA replication/repair protein RecF [Timonella sp. A28]|uniref:DNA replication/repair protein RecF n=1 Tax=Timonella sp. A28 TaxID=3442640 RepID=UPI003EBDE18D